MELRIKRIRPGEFSLHASTGEPITNARHVQTRYERGRAITTVEIIHDETVIGTFDRVKPEGKKPSEAVKKESPHGDSKSEPA